MAPAALTRLSPVKPPGAGLWAEGKPAPAFRVQQKGGLRLCSPAPGGLTLGFPRYRSTWAKQRPGGPSYRTKLDLTPQQLKEVTALTLALPGGPRQPAGLDEL